MVILEVGLVAKAHDPQGGGDGALTRSENGADEQNLGMLPSPFAEDGGKGVQDLYNGTWQVKHISTFLERWFEESFPANFVPPPMDKV
jgi:hypothetical protein